MGFREFASRDLYVMEGILEKFKEYSGKVKL